MHSFNSDQRRSKLDSKTMPDTRTEIDSLGHREIPDMSLFGVSTLRATENFCISGRSIGDEPTLIRALAHIKRAAALANLELGVLDATSCHAIVAAADDIIAGDHADAFPVDILEGSGGTSINMNINEVLANLALDKLGEARGNYDRLGPNDHVNKGQSTNDVVPAAVKLALHEKTQELLATLAYLQSALAKKSAEFDDVLRIGRTCMQAAQPMRLGQAFGGYAASIDRLIDKLSTASNDLLVLPMGGTAIGTGLGAAPGFRACFFKHLGQATNKPVSPPADAFDAMQNADTFARVSSEIRIAAEVIGKIASDLIILSSGSNSGVGEILLPAVQPGSSIMPGKINPVMPMMMQQVAFGVVGNDAAVSLAALNGQLEINHFEPIIASRMFDSIDLLTRAARLFADGCIAGLRANREQSLKNLMDSSAMATIFVDHLGYAKVAKIVKLSLAEGRPFIRLAIEQGLLSEEEVMAVLLDSTYRKDAA
jgi:aspartate ammonia-lyase